MSGDDRTRIATAYEHLESGVLTELACESLSPVEGLCEPGSGCELMYSLRDERDQLAKNVEDQGP